MPEAAIRIASERSFIGEAPGPNEDMKGVPFIGRSGKLLSRIIKESYNRIHPYSFFVLNTLACFPLDKEKDTFREPNHVELAACLPRVVETIELVQPKAVVFVGKTAAKLPTLLKKQNPAWWDMTPHFDKTVTIFHPSYILRRGGHHSFEYKKTVDSLCSFLSPILGIPF